MSKTDCCSYDFWVAVVVVLVIFMCFFVIVVVVVVVVGGHQHNGWSVHFVSSNVCHWELTVGLTSFFAKT